MEYVTVAVRVLLAGVFLLAVLAKVRGRAAFDGFAASLPTARLVPHRLRYPVATTAVLAESAVVALVARPETAAAGLALAAVVSTVLALGVGVVLQRRTRAVCRCFGASGSVLGPVHLVRNAVLAAVALLGLTTAGSGSPDRPGGVLVAVAAGIVLVVVVRFLDDIVLAFAGPEPAAP